MDRLGNSSRTSTHPEEIHRSVAWSLLCRPSSKVGRRFDYPPVTKTCQGGTLSVSHEDTEVLYDWTGEASQETIQWAAFYSDCIHEVSEVTWGHRLTLTYNLFLMPRNDLLTGTKHGLNSEQLTLTRIFREILADPRAMADGGRLGIWLSYMYPYTVGNLIDLMPRSLKGSDMAIYESISALDLKLRLVAGTMYGDECQYDEWGELSNNDVAVVHPDLTKFEISNSSTEYCHIHEILAETEAEVIWPGDIRWLNHQEEKLEQPTTAYIAVSSSLLNSSLY